jgi:hypothetical protein
MKLIASMTCALTLAACGANDSDDPNGNDPAGTREFQLKIENIAPWKLLKVSSQSTIAGTMITGNALPGQAYEIRFTAGPGHYLSFATTLVQSNDWFFAPGDPQGIPLYADGKQVVGDITAAVRLWDAGTEVNQELGIGNATCGNQPTRDYGAPDPDNRVRLVTETTVGGSIVPAVSSMIRVTLAKGTTADSFVLRVENVSTDTTLQNSAGTRNVHISPVAWAISRNPNAFFDANAGVRPNGLGTFAETGLPDSLTQSLRYERGIATALGRGVFLVHREPGPLFYIENSDYGQGLEALAEDGDEQTLLTNLRGEDRGSAAVGAFSTPVGAIGASAAAPGQSFEFTFKAAPGDMLAIATSFTAANDWFFGSPMEGIPLFLGDFPRWEDVTPDVRLWDLGTEYDEELDVGLNTGSQQTAPNSGRVDGKAFAREVTADKYGTSVNQHIRVTLTPIDEID